MRPVLEPPCVGNFNSSLVLNRNLTLGFPGGSDGKESAFSVGDPESIPESGRSPAEGNGNPLQYTCLENPMDGEAWPVKVHGVAKTRTQLSDFTQSLTHSPCSY